MIEAVLVTGIFSEPGKHEKKNRLPDFSWSLEKFHKSDAGDSGKCSLVKLIGEIFVETCPLPSMRLVYLPYIYHKKNQPTLGKYTSLMDGMDVDLSAQIHKPRIQ